MKVRDAFIIIRQLRINRDNYTSLIQDKPFHSDYKEHCLTVRKHDQEIARLEELVHNMELEDSYDEKTLRFLNKYEETEKEVE